VTTIDEFNKWLEHPEDRSLEFKTAENSFGKDTDLPDYCAAISNEGGGKLILGVTNEEKWLERNLFQAPTTRYLTNCFKRSK